MKYSIKSSKYAYISFVSYMYSCSVGKDKLVQVKNMDILRETSWLVKSLCGVMWSKSRFIPRECLRELYRSQSVFELNESEIMIS